MSELTAVVLAAGRGTRMRSDTPKVLHDLCGRPLVGWPVAAVREAGARRVVLVVSPGVDLSAAVAGAGAGDVILAEQPEANGTGGAVVAAEPHLPADGVVLVVNGDVPLVAAGALRGLLEQHAASGAAATVGTATPEVQLPYGRVLRGPDGCVERIVEAKVEGDATPEELAVRELNAGVYTFDAPALRAALALLRPDNAQGELYLTDVVRHLRAAGHDVGAFDIGRDSLQGVNDRVELADARALLQRRILETHMRAGVTIVDPAGTHVDHGVTIGQDVTLHPGTVLRGNTRVGARASVGPHVVAHDAEIGDDVTVGPFAYLRPGTRLLDGSKVGTFVELKNTELGERSKVPHLSYLGDATVGPDSNLGAATITANYDARTRTKSRTVVGAGVKTSVDTTLVAPVTLGDRAFTAAGSVITDDVPEAGLGVARSRQVVVEGYADRDPA